MSGIYTTSVIPLGIPVYANATLFPVIAIDGQQAVAADTNTIYVYDTSVPGWQAVATPGAAIAIDALLGEVTATGPGAVNATITNNAVTNAKLAAMANNTVKGNKSGAPADPSDLALSDLTESTSSVLTITNGSKAIIGAADLTIQVKQSSATQDGYLSSADWSTFNSAASGVSGATASATPNTIAKRDATADCAFNVLKIGAGSAAAPSLADSSNLGTGLFFAGANVVNLSTNGVERLRVDSNGNVGIGSQSPNAKLQVNQSGTQLGLSVYSTSSNNTAELYNQGTTNYTLALNSAANSAQTGASIGGYFARGTLSSRAQTLANDSLLSITASGHTGTGVAGISAGIVLAADQNTGASAFGGQIVLATTPNSTVSLPLPRMVVKNDGSVGIGTLTPSGKLAIAGEMRLFGATSGYVGLLSPAAPVSYSLTLPSAQGAANSVLQNNGSGTLSWGSLPDPLPSQTGNQYKVLATNGTTASWQYDGLGDGSFGTNNVVVGRSKPAGLNSNSTIIGVNAGGGNTNNSTIVGANAFSTGNATECVSVGSYNPGFGNNGIYVGNIQTGSLDVITYDQLVIGNACTNLGDNAICIGNLANVQNDGALAVGYQATASQLNCVALGKQAQSLSTEAIAIGKSARCDGTASISIGLNSNARSDNGIVIGSGAKSGPAAASIVIGYASGNLNFTNKALIVGSQSGLALTNGANNCIFGNNAGVLLTSGGENLFLGNQAGSKSTTQSNELFVDNQSRSSYAVQQTDSLIYGTFNATASAQTLRINGQVNLAQGEKHAAIHAQVGTLNIITATSNNYYIGVDCSANSKTVNLPDATVCGSGFVLKVKDESGAAASNPITLDGFGSQTIDGQLTQPINANYGSLSLMCDGSNWFLT